MSLLDKPRIGKEKLDVSFIRRSPNPKRRLPAVEGKREERGHLSLSEHRQRNRSVTDSREVKNALRERRKAVKSWDALGDTDVQSVVELRRLHHLTGGARRHKLGVATQLSNSDSGLQDSIRGHAAWERPKSICSLSSQSTATASSIQPSEDGQEETSGDDCDALILGSNLLFPSRKESSKADNNNDDYYWNAFRDNTYLSPPPFDDDEDDEDDYSQYEQPKVQLRDEDSPFDGVSSTQMERLQYFQLQQQRLLEQHASLAKSAEQIQGNDGTEEHLPSYTEELPSYSKITEEEGWQSRREKFFNLTGYIEF